MSLDGDGGGVLVELATADADGETGGDRESQARSIARLINRVDQLECEASKHRCNKGHCLSSRKLHSQAILYWKEGIGKEGCKLMLLFILFY